MNDTVPRDGARAGSSAHGVNADDDRERRKVLWWRWFVAATTGEFLGFVAPATAGALSANAAPPLTATALLIAGVIEGGVLGWFQARVLRSVLAGFRASAAITGWFLTRLLSDRYPSPALYRRREWLCA